MAQVALADPAEPLGIQQTFFRRAPVADIDFIKIDVDGADFVILRSLEAILKDVCVFGLAIEVIFFGSHNPDVNTFHMLTGL